MATEEKNKVGRPRLIKTPKEFDERVDKYLAWCRSNEEPILLTGLILALGFASKNTFYEYEKIDEFKDSVKRAQLFVEMEYEKRLNTANSATGPIFALKNFGWKDKHDIDHTSSDRSMSPTGLNDFYADIEQSKSKSSPEGILDDQSKE